MMDSDARPPSPPRHAIAVAGLMCVICGALSILLGLAAFLPVTVILLSGALPPRPAHAMYFAVVVGVALGPGIAYLLLPTYIERRRPGPVMAGAAVAVFQALCALAAAVIAAQVFVERGAGRFASLPPVGSLLIVAVCGTHATCLVRAARAFAAPDFDGPRGFAPTPRADVDED